MKGKRYEKGEAEIFGLVILAWAIASWLTHIIVCLDEEKWGFLIAGALMFPIAIIHGTGVWLGAW